MKKKQYAQQNPEFIRKNKALSFWVVATVLLTIASTCVALLATTKNVFIISSYLSFISAGAVIIIASSFFYRNYSKKVANKVIEQEKRIYIRTLEELPNVSHQHDALSLKLSRLIQYSGNDEAIMGKTKNYLKKTSFDYILPSVQGRVNLQSDRTLAEVIGDDFEELLGHYKSIGWGDYHHRLRGKMKMKIHEEENRQLQLAKEKIQKELELIATLE